MFVGHWHVEYKHQHICRHRHHIYYGLNDTERRNWQQLVRRTSHQWILFKKKLNRTEKQNDNNQRIILEWLWNANSPGIYIYIYINIDKETFIYDEHTSTIKKDTSRHQHPWTRNQPNRERERKKMCEENLFSAGQTHLTTVWLINSICCFCISRCREKREEIHANVIEEQKPNCEEVGWKDREETCKSRCLPFSFQRMKMIIPEHS